MRKSRKFWSLLLALVMVVSLFGGTFVTGAADEGFVKTDALEDGKQYVVVTEADGVYYAMAYSDGAMSAVEVTVSDDTVVPTDDSILWKAIGTQLQSVNSPDVYLYPYAYGMTYSSGRDLIWDGSTFSWNKSSGGTGCLTFTGTEFSYADNNPSAAATILLFVGEAAAAATADPTPTEKPVYPEPETVTRDAVKNADGSITLAFTSDVHYDGENMNLKTWLEAADLGYIDAFGFCGDMGSAYAANVQEYWTWVGEIMDYMDEQIDAGKVGDAIYTHGNHEWFSPYAGGGYGKEYANYEAAQRLMQVGEGLVTDDYIIYCFGCGSSADGTSVGGLDYDMDDLAELDAYLSTAPTDIPIFVLTHMPLHYWYGRSQERYMPHASEVIDVMNKYPNIIVLWGHNHSDFDDNYYEPKFAGSEIVIDPQGTVKPLNFTYLAAGCTADVEYTGPSAGSASCMNKGLIVTIGADGALTYDYITLDGETMHIVSPWLVRFRAAYDNYDVFASQYVEDGKTPEAVEAPELEGYEFSGWTTWVEGVEAEFDFSAPITKNTLVTAKYVKVLKAVDAPDPAECVTVTPDAAYNGAPLTMTAAGVDDLITVFDLASIGYGTGIEYGFWFDADGLVSFDQDVTLYYQGAATDFTLKAGEFYSVAGFGEHYLQLDDGSMLLLLEKDAPGNFASLPGDQPFSAFPGTVDTGAIECMVSNQAVTLDGEAVEIAHYNVNGNNYFKLRDLACILNGTDFQYDVGYDAATRTVTLTTGAAYAPLDTDMVIGEDASDTCVVSNQPVYIDGELVTVLAFNIGGDNYVQLRDLAEYVGYGVDYDSATRTAQILTGSQVTTK